MRQVSPSCYYYNDGRVNSGAIVTGAGPVFIDSMLGPAQALTFYEEVRVVAPHSAHTLITTHEHADHTLGNQVFKCDIIASRTCYERMVHGEERRELPPEVVMTYPNIRFSGELDVEIGGKLINIKHVGGHAPGCSYIWFAEEGVLFSGDLVFEGRNPWLGEADVRQWISILRDLRKLPIQVVVPGHGQAAGPEILDVQAGWLTRLYQEVKGLKHRPIDEIVATVVRDNSFTEREAQFVPIVVRRIVSED